MSTRILVQLASFRSSEDADWRRMMQTFDQLGATHVRPPQPELPNVATAVLPDDADVDGALQRIKEEPSVTNAQVDSWGTAF